MKTKFYNNLLLATVVLLSGCASAPPVPQSVKDEAAKPINCIDAEQCRLYWQRALFYINQHSEFKIQTVTDNLIQTFSPSGGTTRVGYNVVKEPLQGGMYRIWVRVGCDNMFGCHPEKYGETNRMKNYVRSGK